MNTKARRGLLHMKKAHEKEKIETMQQSGCVMDDEKPSTSRRCTSRERKMVLQQDVDKLKKRLRQEENVHRALERAFTRPLGTRPRLPPYLPSHMLELLAEVAILEEEVVRLEERVVHFRQGLYQEAVYISCSKKNMEISDADLLEPNWIKYPNTKQFESTPCMAPHSGEIVSKDSPSQLCNAKKDPTTTICTDARRQEEKQEISKKSQPLRKHPIECGSGERRLDPQAPQLENRVMGAGQESITPVINSPNKISESILKCLMNIILRMSLKNNRNSEYGDPYNICYEFGERDVGPYKNLFAFETNSIDPNRTTISVFLVRRLKLLFQRLATLNLKGLSHQEKLAFWINIYNSCMMNAFIEYGFPKGPESVVELMQKATLNVGGYILNAITIEHFILRRPYHSKYTFSKGTKYDEMMKSSVLGLELSEPLVTFALSCGSWSSPAVRVYTASQVENELEIAKRDYLQAAVGILRIQRVIVAIPKLLDWYLLDFAKDLESLLDWIRLQMPTELAIKGGDEHLVESLRILPYEFSFRYLFHT